LDSAFVDKLIARLGRDRVLSDSADLITYECDALVHLRATPGAVVLPASAADVQTTVRLCHEAGIPFVARGSGTGLSGGALPSPDGVLIVLSRLNRILDVDIPNLRVTVEPGVTNLEITKRVASAGCYYAPDPSSQVVCSIGGNIAENSGGAHCLKYGFTVHHVMGSRRCSPMANWFTSAAAPSIRQDSICSAYRRLGRHAGHCHPGHPAAAAPARSGRHAARGFRVHRRSGRRGVAIISHGIVPAAVEMMDRLTIQAAEAAVHPNFPDTDAVLIVELDGPQVEVDELFGIVEEVCRQSGAVTLEIARDEAQRGRIWKGRKAAFAAMGRVSPNYYVQDGVVPRTKLPEVLRRIRDLEARSGLRIGNVFHAGDGNLHPLICYDETIPGQAAHAETVASEILQYCIEAGGAITGEHGVGADKKAYMGKMFEAPDLDAMQLVRCAFDPRGLCNPRKIFPTPRLCGEIPGPYRQHPAVRAGLAERY
jgi:glycolate oxidase